MKATSLLFFSSSPIALPLLEALTKDLRFEVRAVVCQPDKPSGRGQELTAPATKVFAQKLGIPVYQPEKLSKDVLLLSDMAANPPDFLLTFAYGQLLSKAWLALPKYAPLNVHPSLLPKYRGPAPLEAALLNGDAESGVTLMKMVEAMDAGPIAFQKKFSLPTEMTLGNLYEQVATFAADWIPDAIDELAKQDSFVWTEQNESDVIFCSKLSKEDSFEDFKKTAEVIINRYRAFTPRPGLWTRFQAKRVKILNVLSSSIQLPVGFVSEHNGALFVGTETSAIELKTIQMEGKNPCTASEFLKGYPSFIGAILPS